jgi:hypothetical protein
MKNPPGDGGLIGAQCKEKLILLSISDDPARKALPTFGLVAARSWN